MTWKSWRHVRKLKIWYGFLLVYHPGVQKKICLFNTRRKHKVNFKKISKIKIFVVFVFWPEKPRIFGKNDLKKLKTSQKIKNVVSFEHVKEVRSSKKNLKQSNTSESLFSCCNRKLELNVSIWSAFSKKKFSKKFQTRKISKFRKLWHLSTMI